MEKVEIEDLTFWLHTTDEMEPADFFHAINELERIQPNIFLFLRAMRSTIDNETAYIGFLRMVHIVWKCFESTDARTRTQIITMESINSCVKNRTEMLRYLVTTKDNDEANSIIFGRTRDENQGAVLQFVQGGFLGESEEMFPVTGLMRHVMTTALSGLIDAIDREIVS